MPTTTTTHLFLISPLAFKNMLAILLAVFLFQSSSALAACPGATSCDATVHQSELVGGPLSSLADVTLSSGTLTLIALPSSSVACVAMTNTSANTARIGDLNCGAARCAQVAGGTSITLCTSDAIYGYSASGANISVTLVGK